LAIVRAWVDWQMMQRMKCTYTELQEQPADMLAMIREFVEGEALARKAMATQQQQAANGSAR
jgi:hypothetical protein